MLGPIRTALIAAVVAAAATSGVSLATTGSINPVHMVVTSDANAAVNPSPGADPKEAAEPSESPDAEHHNPTAQTTVVCPTDVKNHGQFVSQSPKGSREEAAHSDCGKPSKIEDKDEKQSTEPSESPEAEHNDNGQQNASVHDNGHDRGGHGEHG